MRAEADQGDVAARALGERLAALYRVVGARNMSDLPVYNAALDVEAIGFHAYEGHALGIVVTPWFMNIVRAPLDGGGDSDMAAPGATVRRVLPAGSFDFTVGSLDGFGRIESCSLFSPMFDFAGPASARATAEAALTAIRDAQFEQTDAADSAPAPRRPTNRPIDRRSLLRGEFREPRP